MTDAREQIKVGPNEILRFLFEIAAIGILAVWGFMAWPLPWPGVLVGIAAPAVAILLWALFLSPKAVLHVDLFIKALVEILVMGAAALALWDLGQPIFAAVFAVAATASGIIHGRKELS